MSDVTYAAVPKLPLLKSRTGKSSSTTVLLGSWLSVLERPGDGWLKVGAFDKEGWVREEHTGPDETLKLFFVDVGQGDAILIEAPGKRIVVDGGAGANFLEYLVTWKYKWLADQHRPIHLDGVFVSHFDDDHVRGITQLLSDDRFTVDRLYHNGIARFVTNPATRPAAFNTDLGTTTGHGTSRRLTTTFSTLDDAIALREGGGLTAAFDAFVTAAETAWRAGRLGTLQGLVAADEPLVGFGELDIRVLGPVPSSTNPLSFRWFADSSHTRNGHSLLLKFTWGTRTVLLGGDLNDVSETELMDSGVAAHFPIDVMKACHHGSSEFSTAFLHAAAPLMTIVSSGDNENYGHPQPDLLGAAGKHSRGDRPLIFSTELARSTTPEGIHYGLINVRTDGQQIIGAQMYEKPRPGDMWNSFIA